LPGSLHTNRRLDRWLSFAEPGVVTAYTGKAELGQGILTALRVVVADELDVALERVRVQSASTVRGPDEAVTSGSLSVQDSATALRHACAEVRFLAAARAAERVGVPAEQVSVQDGRFIDSRGATIGDYWEALAGMDLGREFSGLSKPKPPERRTLIGRADHPRADLPDKVFGRRRFIQDLRMPGMLHARVLRPPTLSAQLESDPEPLLAALPARVRVLLDGRFIALIGPSEHEVDRAAESLRAALRWSSPELLPDGNDLARFLKSAPRQTTLSAQRGCGEAHEGTPLETWPEGGTRFSADYLKPYLAHASIGPSCAMACWSAGRLEVWTHSQGIHNLRDDLVLALAHEPDAPARESIAVHHVEGAGCYGHNGADDVAFDAVLCARFCPGVPVRVMWSRADELRHSPFGAAQAVRLEARLDDAGNISHWHHEIWANGYSSRPGRAKTPTLLAASERAVATPVLPAVNPPLATGGGSDRNAVPGYAISDYRVINHRLTVMPLRTSAMRALGGYANVFAIESFVDEMAWAIGEDPVAFRRRHIRDERALAVIDGVISRSTWWAAPMDTGSGFGRGLGWARYKNSGAWCAAIAHVQVTDRVKVMAIDLAVDVGMVVDLDGVMNQIEGGAIQSASWTTMEQVRFDRHAIQSVGWDTYPIMRFGDVPQLRVHVLDRPDQPPLGAGEAAQGPVAAAIANAVAQALGVRIRELPLDPERLLRAVHAA
jgi:CO/xanthine dehydrogenase Mo-binding subunit